MLKNRKQESRHCSKNEWRVCEELLKKQPHGIRLRRGRGNFYSRPERRCWWDHNQFLPTAISKVGNANTTAVKLCTDHATIHNTEMNNLTIENLKLRHENFDLKSENDDLKERVNNLSYILADLLGKTKKAEEEKDSLIIALWLLIQYLNHKGSVSYRNRSEKIELRCPQTEITHSRQGSVQRSN